jgi:cysteine synthase B
MTSKPVALLLADLGVTKTHARPHVSNDNPFSQAQFKTLKYRPAFPVRFGSIQDRPVLHMLLAALANGRLRPGKTILDSSSGNAGIAYAMVGRIIGYPVEVVIPNNASTERKKRMLAHGAQLVYTDALKGYDEALREVHRRYDADAQHYFFCDQYSNEDNWRAHYETTAVEILEQTGGRLTHIIAGVGTGGTVTGLGRRLKEHDSKIRLICVLPEVFPGIEGLKPLGGPEHIVPRSWTRGSSTNGSQSQVMTPTQCVRG